MKIFFFISSLMLLVSCEDDCGCVTPPKVTQFQNVIVELNDENGHDVLDYLEETNQLNNNLSLWGFKNDYMSINVLKTDADFKSLIYLKSQGSNEVSESSYVSIYRSERIDKKENVNKVAIHYNNLFKNDTIEVFYKPEHNFEMKVGKITVNGSSVIMDSIVVNDYLTIKKIRLTK